MYRINSLDIIDTRTQKIWINYKGILQATCKKLAVQTYDDALENIQATKKIIGNKRYPLLIDMRSMKSISFKARMAYASDNNSMMVNSRAIVISKNLIKILGNVMMWFAKMKKVPTKFFTSNEDAENWLIGFTVH